MKTKIEQHIQSQLSERSLNPSENSWSKLYQMMNEEKPQAKTIRFPKWWMMAVAASVVIFFSIFLVNSFQEIEETTPQITGAKKISDEISTVKNEIISEEIQTETIQINEKSNSNKTEIAKSDVKFKGEINSNKNSEIIPIPVNHEKTSEITLIQQELKLPEPKKQEEIAVNSEPENQLKSETKKSNYASPDMLLYSVENNQAVSESNNDKSRLVIIDFNK